MYKDIEIKPEDKEALVDPMVVEDEEVLAKKKDIWNLIFLLCPNQADDIIKAYEEKGPEALSKAKITIAYETDETPA